MIDFAADTAAIFGDEQGFAVDATYTPDGGSAASIRAIPILSDAEPRFGDAQFVSEAALFRIPVASVAAPAAGDTIEVDGVTYTVQGAPVRNERHLWWTVEAVPA